ncbi:alkaline phosphatase family protein [Alteromonas sp. ASW11-36]|uniref:Alkaline phosphatase family protein n=1 Tax=Alteromonas arenosi TaxID=3055817 RepID=A0ABT7SZ40_9ALTE|nr:alkaline phosphatase family protein [Alteromonas sp. ASW11-36]MDM7861453.1 alkaline phosphatase family protein [Alteromonas sp. ASW11-36]
MSSINTVSNPNIDQVPQVLAGPMLRRTDNEQMVLWLATKRPLQFTVKLRRANQGEDWQTFDKDANLSQHTVTIGEHAHVHLLHIQQADLLEAGSRYQYQITSNDKDLNGELIPTDMYFEGSDCFSFTYNSTLTNVIHGSCRKPHFAGDDALPQVDALLRSDDPNVRPDLLIMSGDQVYVDDVAGPTLNAIRQVIKLLGLFEETLEDATLTHSSELHDSPMGYYKREQILPKTDTNSVLAGLFFKAKRKPIFTSVNAKNHLIAASEIFAMYFLVWSPVLWRFVDLTRPASVDLTFEQLYATELEHIEQFVSSLPATARMFAQVPTYMIFDDHDVTDDWNLTRAWEEAVYNHPLSKRMVGNALLGYWLCQGWANAPEVFTTLQEQVQRSFSKQGINEHDELVEMLFEWDEWQYHLETSPPVYVMDTRTQRWRSESNPDKPSGLLDWEALCEFQQTILGKPSVIVISAAPIYGLKFIEAVQKVFTFFGAALMVDAENWMAHKGTAEVILNIFRHYKTPPLFVILSGDVHYSFVYDVTTRFRRHSPKILQFTSSGFKNAFPPGLLKWFERCNRLFYSKRSPLNWFTRRRNMRIDERDPEPNHRDITMGNVVNAPAIGLLVLDDKGEPTDCSVILADGKRIQFIQD